jgi:hypothetical protein
MSYLAHHQFIFPNGKLFASNLSKATLGKIRITTLQQETSVAHVPATHTSTCDLRDVFHLRCINPADATGGNLWEVDDGGCIGIRGTRLGIVFTQVRPSW